MCSVDLQFSHTYTSLCVCFCTVPDDWCAPLGSEVVAKKDSNECPSVRLRKLYIPLWHVPVVKQEVCNGKAYMWLNFTSLRTIKRRSIVLVA